VFGLTVSKSSNACTMLSNTLRTRLHTWSSDVVNFTGGSLKKDAFELWFRVRSMMNGGGGRVYSVTAKLSDSSPTLSLAMAPLSENISKKSTSRSRLFVTVLLRCVCMTSVIASIYLRAKRGGGGKCSEGVQG